MKRIYTHEIHIKLLKNHVNSYAHHIKAFENHIANICKSYHNK